MSDLMLAEMREQPGVLRRVLDGAQGAVQRLAVAVRRRGVRVAVLAARGSSDHAAVYAKYVLETRNGLLTALAAPSVVTVYHRPPSFAGALVLALSQSGQARDVCAVVEAARADGALTAAIVNDTRSPLAAAAEIVVPLSAGPERAVPATKTYTAQLLVLALLSTALDGDGVDELAKVPDAVEAALAVDVREVVGALRPMGTCVLLGRGYNLCTALEVALKLKETSYVLAEPASPADFQHGPVAIVEEGFPIVVFAPSGEVAAGLAPQLADLRSRGADLTIFSDDAALLAAGRPVRLPVALPEWLSPLPATVAGQRLAHDLAVARGLDPSRPRGLRKVTVTR
ncbi:MAG: SIS domain-containing protein [Chloroflexi bacterium]|nr:SIS domain-containing protein [Chloroflexota bacterium]